MKSCKHILAKYQANALSKNFRLSYLIKQKGRCVNYVMQYTCSENAKNINMRFIVGLNIFIHINEYKHINKQYITMVYDGIQKEAIRLIRNELEFTIYR